MTDTPDQPTINALVHKLRPKQAPKTAQGNGHTNSWKIPGQPSDSEVLEKLFDERDGQKWREVYNGNWEPHYGSQSSADAAILHKLAYRTAGDSSQVERIMRGSGLARQKWDSRRGGNTWLASEIARAIENTPESYEWKTARSRSRSHSLGDLGMSNEPEP